jgi:hypothetical protein
VWRAALAGGLAAGVAGALVEDSGPVLFVVAVAALGCELGYLWGRPRWQYSRGAASAAPAGARRALAGEAHSASAARSGRRATLT